MIFIARGRFLIVLLALLTARGNSDTEPRSWPEQAGSRRQSVWIVEASDDPDLREEDDRFIEEARRYRNVDIRRCSLSCKMISRLKRRDICVLLTPRTELTVAEALCLVKAGQHGVRFIRFGFQEWEPKAALRKLDRQIFGVKDVAVPLDTELSAAAVVATKQNPLFNGIRLGIRGNIWASLTRPVLVLRPGTKTLLSAKDITGSLSPVAWKYKTRNVVSYSVALGSGRTFSDIGSRRLVVNAIGDLLDR